MVGKIKQAVILAGGMGIRLRPFTYDNPKLMVRVNGKPFLDYLLELLKLNGITEVVILLGYLPEKVTEYLGDGSKFGIKVKYSIGALDDGTATRLKNAEELLHDSFLVLYCDNYLHLDLEKIVDFHNKRDVLVTATVYSNNYGVTKNNIFVGEDGCVVKYDKTRKTSGLNGVELGFFMMSKDVLKLIPPGICYLDEVILPMLVAQKKLAGFVTDQLYYSLSTPERMKLTENFLKSRKVVFLDRDGVINKKMPRGEYVKDWSEFEFLPGAIEAMKMLCDNDYEIYIVSNQAGIGRGLMREADLFQIHKNMESELGEHGVKISGIYYCLHRSDEGCDCRKPKPGMLFRAAIDYQIDLPGAYFVGDDERDMAAGSAAGCKTMLVSDGRGGLLGAARAILKG